jgi:hypothetical protein
LALWLEALDDMDRLSPESEEGDEHDQAVDERRGRAARKTWRQPGVEEDRMEERS